MYYVKVKMKDRKRAELLANGDGSLTGKRVHAARIAEKSEAERIAAKVASENPDLVEWAKAVAA